MPRKSRIDTPGALHHIIARGIDRKNIFKDDKDRDDFLERLGVIIEETQTYCFAWALIPNHFHLLIKTGATPISTVMRRLLTGYAVSFNRRHRRYGHPSRGGSTTFSKSLQIASMPGGCLSFGVSSLYSFKSPACRDCR